MWYNIHVLKGRTQRRSPGTRKGIPMKKFKITQGEKTWLFIQLENAVAVYEANQDENAKGQVFKTMEEAIFNIFAEKEDADNV